MNTKFLDHMGSIIVAKQYEETLHNLQTPLWIEMEFSTTGEGNPNTLLVTTNYHALKDELCRKYPTDFVLELLLHIDLPTPDIVRVMKKYPVLNVWCNNYWLRHVPFSAHKQALDRCAGELVCIHITNGDYIATYLDPIDLSISEIVL